MTLKIFNTNIVYYSILSLFSILIVGYVLVVYLYPSISEDSGYYLKIAYDLANGLSFFKDLNCSYSPLAMYVFSLPFYFDSNTGLIALFTYYFLMFPLIGFVFFHILKYYNSSTKVCLFFSVLLISANIVFEGTHILLEPYLLLFQLLALWILLKWKLKPQALILVGLFVFLAFYVKQYGLFIMPALVFWIYKKTEDLKTFALKFSFLISGFIVPIIILSGYFYIYEDLSIKIFLLKLFGIPALQGDEIVTGINYSVVKVFKKIGQFIIDFPFFLLMIFLFFYKKAGTNSWFTLLVLAGAFCMLYFAYYSHYFQLIIPYVVLLTVINISKIFEEKFIIVLALSVVFIVGASLKLKNRFIERKPLHYEQTTNVPILKSNVSNKNVYLHGISPAYYFLSKYNSANYPVLGYKFTSEFPLNKISNEVLKGNCILIEPEFYKPEIFSSYEIKNEFFIKKGYKDQKILLLEKVDN